MEDMTYDQYHKIMNNRFNQGALPVRQPRDTISAAMPNRMAITQELANRPRPKKRKTVMDALGKLNSAFQSHAGAFDANFDPTGGAETETPIGSINQFGKDFQRFTGSGYLTDQANANSTEGELVGMGDDAIPSTVLDPVFALSDRMTDSANANRMAAGKDVAGYPNGTLTSTEHTNITPKLGSLSDEANTDIMGKGVPRIKPSAIPSSLDGGDNVHMLRKANGDLAGTGFMSFSGKGNVGGISNAEVLSNLIKNRDSALTNQIKGEMALRTKQTASALPHMMSYAEALGKTSNGNPRNIEEAMMSMKLAKNVLAQNNRNVRMSGRIANKQRELAQQDRTQASTQKYQEALIRKAEAMIDSTPSVAEKMTVEQRKSRSLMLSKLFELEQEATTPEEKFSIQQRIKGVVSGKIKITTRAAIPESGHWYSGGVTPKQPALTEMVNIER